MITCGMVTIAFACNSVRASVGLFTIMIYICKVGAVDLTAPIGYGCVG